MRLVFHYHLPRRLPLSGSPARRSGVRRGLPLAATLTFAALSIVTTSNTVMAADRTEAMVQVANDAEVLSAAAAGQLEPSKLRWKSGAMTFLFEERALGSGMAFGSLRALAELTGWCLDAFGLPRAPGVAAASSR